MSTYLIFLFLLSIVNHLSLGNIQTNRFVSSNMTCVTIPFATLSSRSDDKFTQLKFFASPQFNSNLTTTCGKFNM